MIRHIHHALVSNSLTRKLQRRIVRGLKSSLSVPDPYSDLARIVREKKPDAILDIGSHVGETISRLLETSSVPIHGFEPTQKTFQKLSLRFQNDPTVMLHKLALSNSNGEATFHCNVNEQTNSLLDNGVGNNESMAHATQHLQKEVVETMRLDDWVGTHLPSAKIVVKSDVQGAEGLLVEGGEKCLRDQTIAFYSEAQIAPMYEGQADLCELHKILTGKLGFVLHNIYPCYHDNQGRALQTDALWINTKFMETN